MPVDRIENEPDGVLTLALRGASAAVIVLNGAWDSAEVWRLGRVLRTVVETDVPRVIVDVSTIELGRPLADVLRAMRSEARRRGGWLLVEGDPDGLLGNGVPLIEAFRAYREATAAVAEPAVA